MARYKITTICISALITIGLATLCHELGHVIAGRMAGGMPTLITSTEVKGNFDTLSPAGFVVLGISGSVVNVLFCVLGWWLLRRTSPVAEMQLFAWFFFAVNGLLVVTAMLTEALVGFGDWMTILQGLPAAGVLRALVVLLGLVGTIFMVRRSGATLGRLIPDGEPQQRTAEARRIVLVGAVASSILMLGSSVLSPVEAARAMLLSLGATLGPFIPMIFATRFVAKIPSENNSPTTSGGWPWFLAVGLLVIIIWFIVGPGILL